MAAGTRRHPERQRPVYRTGRALSCHNKTNHNCSFYWPLGRIDSFIAIGYSKGALRSSTSEVVSNPLPGLSGCTGASDRGSFGEYGSDPDHCTHPGPNSAGPPGDYPCSGQQTREPTVGSPTQHTQSDITDSDRLHRRFSRVPFPLLSPCHTGVVRRWQISAAQQR